MRGIQRVENTSGPGAAMSIRLASISEIIIGAFLVGSLAACGRGSTERSDSAAAPAAEKTAAANANEPAETHETLVTSRNACDLLTRSDAEAAVGQPLPQNAVNLDLGTCDYNAADFSAGANVAVGSWESITNAAKNDAISTRHQLEALSGVGDEALYFAQETGAATIYVRRGDEGFMLLLHGPRIDHMAGAGALAVEKDLAMKMLKRF